LRLLLGQENLVFLSRIMKHLKYVGTVNATQRIEIPIKKMVI